MELLSSTFELNYLFIIYSDRVQSFTLNDYHLDVGIGKGTGNWTSTNMELARAEVLDTGAW